MHAPEFRDRRLAGDTIRRLDEFAAAEESGAESAALAAYLTGELSKLSPFGIGALQRAVRDAYRHAPYHSPKRAPTLGERVAGLFVTPKEPPRQPPSPQGQWLRLMHPNGYVREAVLKAIGEPPAAPIFLAALLLGLNDHVPQVRTAAIQCLERSAPSIPDAVIADAVPYIVIRRPDWIGVVGKEAIDGLLGRDAVRHSTRALLMSGTQAWLPRFFRALLASDVADRWLVDLATGAKHPSIRARATLVLVEGRVDRLAEFRHLWRDPLRNPSRPVDLPFDMGKLISAGARDRTVAVRKAAAEGLVRHYKNLQDAPQLIDAFGHEKNAAIRNRLDFIRRQLVAG